ncbi:MAG: hypothetical protein NVS2B12_05930 [Ktedonobacteraceae bacterium]
MGQVKTGSDLVRIEMTDDDISQGVSYGIISRAWTYDRMGAQARGDFGKAIFRIAVGKAVQAAIERYLSEMGIAVERDTTDYRTSDYWDIATRTGKSIDVKAFQFFSDFRVPGRSPLNPALLVESTLGESWSSFFPMLIPQDQFDGKMKDFYIFAALSAPGSKRCPNTHENPRGLIALPYSQDEQTNSRFQSVHFASFAERRIRAGKTFEIALTRRALHPEPFNITIGYANSTGEAKYQSFALQNGETVTLANTTALHYLKWERRRCPPHNMGTLLEATFTGVDTLGPLKWVINNSSFEDVWIYPNALWCIGWISKEAFSATRRRYPTYGPSDNTNKKLGNQGGILHRGGFVYFYPPGFRGGTKDENYYVLPQDLNTINTLPAYLTE